MPISLRDKTEKFIDVFVVYFEANTMTMYSVKEDELLCEVWLDISVEFQGMEHNAAFWQSVHDWFHEKSIMSPTTRK